MKKFLQTIFAVEQHPRQGLFMFEWAMAVYLLLTLVMITFSYSTLVNPESMLFGRLRVVIVTALLWGIYRLYPCRVTVALRLGGLSAMLAWWYADTYELNRSLPNLDHVFAQLEQSLFGCQPSLEFSRLMPWDVVSELLYLGYYSYFYLILATALLYYIIRYEEFERATFVLMGSFFAYYLVFDFLPVVGPQYYYEAIGLDSVQRGIFPDVGNYFMTHQELFPAPGHDGNFFRSFVEGGAVRAGERPTAAFPSSHVGLSTVVCCLLVRFGRMEHNWRPLYIFLPFYVLLCLATVYIHAHYAVDAIAGFVTGLMLYFGLSMVCRRR